MSSRTSRKSKYSKGQLPTEWSEWTWNNEESCWGRYRLDRHGEYEIQNRPAEQTQAASSQSNQVSSEAWPASTQSNEGKSVPRTVPAPEDVPASREDSSQYGTSPTYTYDLEERLGSMTLDKGKGRDTGYVEAEQNVFVASSAPPLDDRSTVEESAFQAARTNSLYPAQSLGQSSSQLSYNTAPNPIWHRLTVSSAGPPLQAQTAQHQPENYIASTTPGDEEPLDKRYKVHHGGEFKVGSVFKILWAEPTGVNGTQITDQDQMVSHSQKHQEQFIHKIRRFVVVRRFHGHCLCLPIQTYQRKATTKFAGHPQALEHTVIYTEKPVTFHGEKFQKQPIKVVPNSPREKLAPESRMNYAKVYTIEFNVKVLFIGRVHKDSRHVVEADYRNTQNLGTEARPEPAVPGYQDSARDTRHADRE